MSMSTLWLGSPTLFYLCRVLRLFVCYSTCQASVRVSKYVGINVEIVYFVLGMYKAHALLLSWVVASFSTSYERTRSAMFFLTFVLSCHSYTYFCCSCCSLCWFLVVVVGYCSFAPKPQERIQHCQTSTRCCILVFVVIVLLFWSGLFCFWRLFFHIHCTYRL